MQTRICVRRHFTVAAGSSISEQP